MVLLVILSYINFLSLGLASISFPTQSETISHSSCYSIKCKIHHLLDHNLCLLLLLLLLNDNSCLIVVSHLVVHHWHGWSHHHWCRLLLRRRIACIIIMPGGSMWHYEVNCALSSLVEVNLYCTRSYSKNWVQYVAEPGSANLLAMHF